MKIDSMPQLLGAIRKHYTQQQLSEITGVPFSSIGNWLYKGHYPRSDRLIEALDKLGYELVLKEKDD